MASSRLSPLPALEITFAGGRPQIDAELRDLIRCMSLDNPLWGSFAIHGELLKLGFEVAQSIVAKYMLVRRVTQLPATKPLALQNFEDSSSG